MPPRPIRTNAVAHSSGAVAPLRRRCASETFQTPAENGDSWSAPQDYQRAEATAEFADAELLGFYHSHPNHPAVPSAFDLQHAWPNLSYVIVSVSKSATASAESGALRSWRLRHDRTAFDEENVSTSCQ